jgi:hypothetical protein
MDPNLWIDLQELLSLVFYPLVISYYMIGLAGSLLIAVMVVLIGSITKKL